MQGIYNQCTKFVILNTDEDPLFPAEWKGRGYGFSFAIIFSAETIETENVRSEIIERLEGEFRGALKVRYDEVTRTGLMQTLQRPRGWDKSAIELMTLAERESYNGCDPYDV